jgi:hypothetical protein
MAGGIILTPPWYTSTVHVHQNVQTNHSNKLAVDDASLHHHDVVKFLM